MAQNPASSIPFGLNPFDLIGGVTGAVSSYYGAKTAKEQNKLKQQLISQYQQERDRANAMNEQRYKEMLAIQDQRLADVQGGYGSLLQGYGQQQQALMGQQGYGGLLDAFRGREQAIAGQYGDLSSLMAGLGQRAAADIGQRYTAERGRADQSLTSRGLGNTTVRSSVERGLTEAESQDRQRLAEALLQQRIGLGTEAARTQAQLSGDTLTARTRGVDLLSQLLGQGLSAQERGVGAASGVRQDRIQNIENRYDVAPSLEGLASALFSGGQTAGQAPTYGTALQSLLAPFQQAQQRQHELALREKNPGYPYDTSLPSPYAANLSDQYGNQRFRIDLPSMYQV